MLAQYFKNSYKMQRRHWRLNDKQVEILVSDLYTFSGGGFPFLWSCTLASTRAEKKKIIHFY